VISGGINPDLTTIGNCSSVKQAINVLGSKFTKLIVVLMIGNK
jgi:hypothetical protein